jgi:hypothetical protein
MKNDILPWDQTPDLRGSFSPVPKVYKMKKAPKQLGTGDKVASWEEGRKLLKVAFKENKIVTCEIAFAKICKKDNYLGFAHIRRRNTLKPEQVVDAHYVVLACVACHEVVDQKMQKADAEKLLDKIVESRGW